MRVLFAEPFYGGSHRDLLDGLRRHSTHEILPLVMEGERWRARMRRGAQYLARDVASIEGTPDLIVATDMLDLPAFLALTRRTLGSTPSMLYMHENQFTYPRIRGTKLNSWFGQINYLSATVADCVAFNSEYHRRDFLAALSTLRSEPNNWLVPDTVEAIEAKSFVLPLGLELSPLDGSRVKDPNGSARVVWNQRWEFDRAPDMFVRVLEKVAGDVPNFEVAVAGDPGENPHPALLALPEMLGDRLVHHGFAETRSEYARLLRSSDIVVSTTRHEFFGIGMVEALYCGCVPLAPAAFTYPELVPDQFHEACLFDDEAGFEDRLRAFLGGERPNSDVFREAVFRYDWSTMGRHWDRVLESAADGKIPTTDIMS